MRLRVDPKIPLPIGAQIAEGIQLAIARGELRAGDQLPTVRQLAVDLRVNSNTVARVYSDLERAGVLETRRGKGSFVREPQPARGQRVRESRLRALIAQFVTGCQREGYSLDDVLTGLRELRSGDKER